MIVCVRTRNLQVVASDIKPVKTCDIITFDIICLNETRLNCSIDNSEVGIPGYDLQSVTLKGETLKSERLVFATNCKNNL